MAFNWTGQVEIGNSVELAQLTHWFRKSFKDHSKYWRGKYCCSPSILPCKNCQHGRDLCLLGHFYLTLQPIMLFLSSLRFFLGRPRVSFSWILIWYFDAKFFITSAFFLRLWGKFTSAFLRLRLLDCLIEKADCWCCEVMTGVNNDVVGTGSNDGLGWWWRA